MPRHNRRIATTQTNKRRQRKERRPNVYTGPAPERPSNDDEIASAAEQPVSGGESGATTAPATSAARARRRSAARARRVSTGRNRAAVFSQNITAELRKLGVMAGATVVALGVLTFLLG